MSSNTSEDAIKILRRGGHQPSGDQSNTKTGHQAPTPSDVPINRAKPPSGGSGGKPPAGDKK